MRRRKGPSLGRNQRPAQTLPTPAGLIPETPRPQTPYERELTTKRRGEISELAFALAAARHGFGISRPYGDSERYDLILDPSHVVPVIPSEAKRKRARWRVCSKPAERDLLFTGPRSRVSSVIPTAAERQRAQWRACPEPAEGDLLFAPRPRLIRVQVKATTQLQYGLYRANAHRRINGKAVAYTLDEIDFFVAYVIPEDSWFIFPLSHIFGSTAVTLSPKRRRKRHINDPYREAWHLLYEPDGIEFA